MIIEALTQMDHASTRVFIDILAAGNPFGEIEPGGPSQLVNGIKKFLSIVKLVCLGMAIAAIMVSGIGIMISRRRGDGEHEGLSLAMAIGGGLLLISGASWIIEAFI